MKTPKLRLLLIEDETDLAANVVEYFEERGHEVDYAEDGERGVALALAGAFDVVVLDVMLPRMGGIEVCTAIRERATRQVPILMLSARDALSDKILGFDSGADDYLTKPFALVELLARCQALARRRELQRGSVLTIGSLSVNVRTRVAMRGATALKLTPKGFEILRALAEAYPEPVTRSELLERIWGPDWPDSDALRSHIYALRQELDGSHPRRMLETLHGVGFKLEADE
ncbi:MAG TPA: response regulator transcription factor [Thermoanaerobaculia bacterium]|nr:response regulator transcription factor [Thermoanaerobaculia bacterium]